MVMWPPRPTEGQTGPVKGEDLEGTRGDLVPRSHRCCVLSGHTEASSLAVDAAVLCLTYDTEHPRGRRKGHWIDWWIVPCL